MQECNSLLNKLDKSIMPWIKKRVQWTESKQDFSSIPVSCVPLHTTRVTLWTETESSSQIPLNMAPKPKENKRNEGRK